MYQCRILARAEDEVVKAKIWYNEQKDGLGDRFYAEIVFTLRRIEKGPLLYQERSSKKFRFAVVKDFPFTIMFKITKTQIVVYSVFHTSRNPKKFL